MATLSEAPKTATPATRVEEDLLGQRHVPADAYLLRYSYPSRCRKLQHL